MSHKILIYFTQNTYIFFKALQKNNFKMISKSLSQRERAQWRSQRREKELVNHFSKGRYVVFEIISNVNSHLCCDSGSLQMVF